MGQLRYAQNDPAGDPMALLREGEFVISISADTSQFEAALAKLNEEQGGR